VSEHLGLESEVKVRLILIGWTDAMVTEDGDDAGVHQRGHDLAASGRGRVASTTVSKVMERRKHRVVTFSFFITAAVGRVYDVVWLHNIVVMMLRGTGSRLGPSGRTWPEAQWPSGVKTTTSLPGRRSSRWSLQTERLALSWRSCLFRSSDAGLFLHGDVKVTWRRHDPLGPASNDEDRITRTS